MRSAVLLAGIVCAALAAVPPVAAQHPITGYTSPGVLNLAAITAVAPDGSFAVAGQVAFGAAPGAAGGFVARLDTANRIVWQEIVGGARFSDIVSTGDGGYVAAGDTGDPVPRAWVVKLGAAGEIVWERAYGVAGRFVQARAVAVLADGGLLVVGEILPRIPPGAGPSSLWVFRLSPAGDVLWQGTYGDLTPNVVTGGVVALTDGGAVISTRRGANNAVSTLLRLDFLGNVVWERGLPGLSLASISAGGGDTVLAVASLSCGARAVCAWIARVDASPLLLWQKVFAHDFTITTPGSVGGAFPRSAVARDDGTIGVAMGIGSSTSVARSFLASLDASGATLGVSGYTLSLGTLRKAPDGGYRFLGGGLGQGGLGGTGTLDGAGGLDPACGAFAAAVAPTVTNGAIALVSSDVVTAPTDAIPQETGAVVHPIDLATLDACGPFRSTADTFVRELYLRFFGRIADVDEVAAWRAYIDANPTFPAAAALVRDFITSSEPLNHDIATVDFVTALYNGVLGRGASGSEMSPWIDDVNARYDSPLPGFFGSAEFHALVPSAQDTAAVTAFVTRLYREALRRSPEAVELGSGVAYIASSGDFVGYTHGILGSTEYTALANNIHSPVDHVATLYRAILGREPDAAGQAAWLAEVAGQLGELGDFFVASPEFRSARGNLFH